MKRIILILAAGLALFLTGCATNYDAYAKAQSEIATAQSNAETARLVALAKIAESGDAGAKVGAVMALALSGQRQTTQLQAPQSQAMEWARLLLNPLVSLYGINRNANVQIKQIDAQTAQHATTFGTLENIAITGMQEAGKVTFPPVYTVPMGSAAATPETPATETPAATTP